MEENNNLELQISRYLAKFSPEWMEFPLWLSEFEYLLDFLRIRNDKKVEFLIYMMEPIIIKDIKRKVFPNDPTKLPYDKLISKLEEMYSLFTGVEAVEYRFIHRIQLMGETISQYVIALKKLINYCSPTFQTDDNLVAQFKKGLRSQAAKSILSKEKNLTLDKAIAIARKIETCEVKFPCNDIIHKKMECN